MDITKHVIFGVWRHGYEKNNILQNFEIKKFEFLEKILKTKDKLPIVTIPMFILDKLL
jgi:hypothetical protein